MHPPGVRITVCACVYVQGTGWQRPCLARGPQWFGLEGQGRLGPPLAQAATPPTGLREGGGAGASRTPRRPAAVPQPRE